MLVADSTIESHGGERVLDRMRGAAQAVRMNHDKRAIVTRYFEEVWNQGREELVDELLHPDYVNHSPGSPHMSTGREGVKWVLQALRAAFPDLFYRIEDIVVGDDAVAVRTTLTGTHRGDFFGLPATGRSVRVRQMNIERFRDGRIVAHHRITDDLAMMRQLGVAPESKPG
jgi:steroid delta-isomerase-like uncharacterized protein